MSSAVSHSVVEIWASTAPLPARSIQERALDSGRLDLSQLWRWLWAGELRFVSWLTAGDRSFATMEITLDSGPGLPTVSTLLLLLLQRLLEGACAKALADEQHIALSTLNARCAALLALIGPQRKLSRAPVLLAMAAHAAKGFVLGQAHVDAVAGGRTRRWIVGIPNPVLGIRGCLTDSEYAVACLAVDGRSHAEIALMLGKSQRTVANQLASIFRKLGVSGRAALRAKAIREYAKRFDVDAHAQEPEARLTMHLGHRGYPNRALVSARFGTSS